MGKIKNEKMKKKERSRRKEKTNQKINEKVIKMKELKVRRIHKRSKNK